MMAAWFGRLVAVVGLTVVASIAAQTPSAKQTASSAPAGNAETGQKLYTSIGCWQCHGYEGQGGAAGPRLAGRLAPFAVFSMYVRRPANQMPPYTEKVVSDTDLADVYAFLQSRPAPPPVESITLLQK